MASFIYVLIPKRPKPGGKLLSISQFKLEQYYEGQAWNKIFMCTE